jgi:hypothetical protein
MGLRIDGDTHNGLRAGGDLEEIISMNTSQTTVLPKPTGNEKISLGTFGYINARNRQRAYDIVIHEFKKSGLTQASLASRMGKTSDIVCRWLSRPQNWETDTFSSLLFAISGAVPKYDLTYPLGKQKASTETVFKIRAAQ